MYQSVPKSRIEILFTSHVFSACVLSFDEYIEESMLSFSVPFKTNLSFLQSLADFGMSRMTAFSGVFSIGFPMIL